MKHPFEPLRANRIWGAGWSTAFGRCVPDPLRGAGLPRPPVGGWGDVCARPLMGGRAAPPPRGGLGWRSLGFDRKG